MEISEETDFAASLTNYANSLVFSLFSILNNGLGQLFSLYNADMKITLLDAFH